MSQTAEIPDMTATSGLCLFLYQAAFPANKMLLSASSKNFFSWKLSAISWLTCR